MESARSGLRPRHLGRSRGGGFSLMELLLVLVLLGVLAALVGPRLPDVSAYRASAFHAQLLSSLRYAQKLAVGGGCPVRVTVAGDAYALYRGQTDCQDSALTRPVLDPARREPMAASAPAGTSVTAADFVLTAHGDVAGGGAINLSVTNNSASWDLTVHGGTGYVEAVP